MLLALILNFNTNNSLFRLIRVLVITVLSMCMVLAKVGVLIPPGQNCTSPC